MNAETILIGALVINAVIGFAYRVYRLSQGGPRADVIGQALLGVVLGALAASLALGMGWARWGALAYGALFGVVVMPVYVLAVLIPMRPRAIDYAFTGLYWIALAVIVAAAALL